MGIIKGTLAFAAVILNAFSFLILIDRWVPDFITVNPMITLALGATLLSIWALLD